MQQIRDYDTFQTGYQRGLFSLSDNVVRTNNEWTQPKMLQELKLKRFPPQKKYPHILATGRPIKFTERRLKANPYFGFR